MEGKLAHSLIFLVLARSLVAHEECDSSVGDCQGDRHAAIEEGENKYSEEVNVLDSGALEREGQDFERDGRKGINGPAEQDASYREMFDKDGLFNRELAKEYLDKEDYEQAFRFP